GAAGLGTMAGNWTASNPPFGAVFTFNLRDDLQADSKLVMTISDDTGKQVRRFEIPNGKGLRRAAWNLRADLPAAEAGRAGGAGRAEGAGRAGGAGGGGQAGAAGGRGVQQGPLVVPGRYRAQLGKQVGNDVTPLGAPQTFTVVAIDR